MGFDLIHIIITTATEEGNVFNWGFAAKHAVNFIILFGVLAYFLKDSIRNFLVERRGMIGNEIESAEKAIAGAKERYQEYTDKLKRMDDEIKSLKETIKKGGEVERREIIRQAEAISQKIREEVRETIKIETAKARREIQSEAVTVAIGIAESIIKQNLSQADEKRLIDDFIKKVEDEKWRQSQH